MNIINLIVLLVTSLVSCVSAARNSTFVRLIPFASNDEIRSKILGGEDVEHVVPYQISLQVKVSR